jgi:hypothetical protein
MPVPAAIAVEALGLDFLEIRRVVPQRKSPKSGDSRSL